MASEPSSVPPGKPVLEEHTPPPDPAGGGGGPDSWPDWMYGAMLTTLVLLGLVVVVGVVLGLSSPSFRQALADPGQARGIVTFMIAIMSMTIVLVTLVAILFVDKDDLPRIEMARGLLTVVVGILGTIIGYYFGASDGHENTTASKGAAQSAFTETIGTAGALLITLDPDTAVRAIQMNDGKGGRVALPRDPNDPARYLLGLKAETSCPAGATVFLMDDKGADIRRAQLNTGKDALRAAGWKQC